MPKVRTPCTPDGESKNTSSWHLVFIADRWALAQNSTGVRTGIFTLDDDVAESGGFRCVYCTTVGGYVILMYCDVCMLGYIPNR